MHCTWHAGIEHARAAGERAYRGRKPSFSRAQMTAVRDLLGAGNPIASIAREVGLSRQTIYRIEADPAGAEAALAAWGL